MDGPDNGRRDGRKGRRRTSIISQRKSALSSRAKIGAPLTQPQNPPPPPRESSSVGLLRTTMASTETPTVPFFKKKGKARPTAARKRSTSPSVAHTEASSSAKSQVVLPSKKAASNLLSAGTKRKISDRDDDLDAPEREGPDVKWSSSGSHVNAALDIIAGDELEELEEKRRIREKAAAGSDDEMPDDGQYRGQSAYKSHLKKNKEIPKAMRVGPQRSTNTIRTVTIVDYQPDVCKDYKGAFAK